MESTVRSIRSVNTKDVSDGKATPTEDIKVTGKAGDLALGTEAGNETETNGTEASTETKLKGDSINSMTDANITSIVAPFGAGFQDSSDLATKNELWHLTEEHVWPAMLAEAEEIALDHKKASDIDIAKILADSAASGGPTGRCCAASMLSTLSRTLHFSDSLPRRSPLHRPSASG